MGPGFESLKVHQSFEWLFYIMQVWTRGYLLRKWNRTACAYEIRRFDGIEFLFLEWKNGDYIWGGREPKWYVFCRA